MIRHELRQALRSQLRRPWPTLTIVLTLALGIGVNTAIFTLVSSVLLRPLPFPDGHRLVVVRQTYESLKTSPNPRLQSIWNRIPVSYLNAEDWRRDSRSLAGVGLYAESTVTLLGGGEPLAVEAAQVDAELFEILAVAPALGRTFTAQEVERQERLVVLGHPLWTKLWGGDPGILDTVIELDGEPATVVGVMPAGFQITGGRDDRLWTPLRLSENDLQVRNNQRLSALGRLAEGVSFESAGEELERLARNQAETYPDTNDGTGVRLEPLLDSIVAESRSLLTLLMAAVAMVLAVACANVAHLLWVQADRRRDELGIRRALGASRSRLTRQLLLESAIPAFAGGLLALPLAAFTRRLLVAWLPADLPRTETLPIDGRVLVFTLGVSLLATLLCGLPVALASSTADATRRARGNAGAATGRRGAWFHQILVVAEIALTLMLTAGAGLLANSFVRLAAVEPGFTTEGILVQDIRLPTWSHPDESRRQVFAEQLLARLRTVPGVRSVALTSKLPFAGPALVAGFSLAGAEAETENWTQGLSASLKFVSPEYFATLGIPLREGRFFTPEDRPDSGRVLVMNEGLANRCWPGEDAVGRSIVFSDNEYRVVGVVADIRHDGLAKDPGLLMYFPWNHHGDLTALAEQLTVVAGVDGDPMDFAAIARGIVREVEPALPLPAATTLEYLVSESLGAPRGRSSLALLLAALALVLALVGTYAVVSFTVGRRRAEIGVRMAFGATAHQVQAMVLGRTLALAALGIGIGIAGALAGGRLLEGMLWGVGAGDPATLASAALLLAGAAVLAGYLPARRASRIDPVRALRQE